MSIVISLLVVNVCIYICITNERLLNLRFLKLDKIEVDFNFNFEKILGINCLELILKNYEVNFKFLKNGNYSKICKI